MADTTIDNVPLLSNSEMTHLGSKNSDLQYIEKYKDSFILNSEKLDVERWNKLYPYQLVICKYEDGTYFPTQWKFTLPMTPQELVIQTPFAITQTLTADGVAEEHSGVKVKQIQFSGSLGSAPLRGSAQQYNPDDMDVLHYVAGGTINAVENLMQSTKDFASKDGTPRLINNYIEKYDELKAEIKDTYYTTGYVQHLLLDKFLQTYAAWKASSLGEAYRLAFCMWKNDTVYLVTPVSYSIKRSASSPSEYTYDLMLKAWKRVELKGDVTTISRPTPQKKGWTVNRGLQKLQEARNVIYNAKQTVEAVRGDADRLMSVVRETVLAARDTVGVAKTILDLPATIKGDFKVLIEKQVKNLKEDIKATGKAAEDWKKL